MENGSGSRSDEQSALSDEDEHSVDGVQIAYRYEVLVAILPKQSHFLHFSAAPDPGDI